MERIVTGALALLLAATSMAATQSNTPPIIGGIKAKRKEKEETEQADKQAAANKNAQQPLDNFKRSLSSCLDARGYSVR